MEDFTTSATALEKFATCPQQYWFYKHYKPKRVAKWLQDGLDAHAILAGEGTPATVSPDAYSFAASLKSLEESRKWDRVVAREYKNIAPLYSTHQYRINIDRRMDVLALDRYGIPIVADYKTTRNLWDTVQGHVPKAEAFQAVAYTTPFNAKELSMSGWPSRIEFLVATLNGDMEAYTYQPNAIDREDLIETALMARHQTIRDKFPKHKGFGCKWCDFAPACFEKPGWAAHYTER